MQFPPCFHLDVSLLELCTSFAAKAFPVQAPKLGNARVRALVHTDVRTAEAATGRRRPDLGECSCSVALCRLKVRGAGAVLQLGPAVASRPPRRQKPAWLEATRTLEVEQRNTSENKLPLPVKQAISFAGLHFIYGLSQRRVQPSEHSQPPPTTPCVRAARASSLRSGSSWPVPPGSSGPQSPNNKTGKRTLGRM